MTDTDAPRRLEYVPLNELLTKLDPSNVKSHDDEGIDASLDRFGYTEPVMIDERTGKLVAGHGRIQRLHALFTDPETDVAKPPEGVITEVHGLADAIWSVPVVRGWASQDDDEARAYMITANRLTEKGGWTDLLATQLEELAATPAGLPPGFTPDELDTLLAEVGAGQLAAQDTDAAHADDLSNRGEPATPRQVQGLHEVGLMFQAEAHSDYLATVTALRRHWGADMAAPMVVLRALHLALENIE